MFRIGKIKTLKSRPLLAVYIIFHFVSCSNSKLVNAEFRKQKTNNVQVVSSNSNVLFYGLSNILRINSTNQEIYLTAPPYSIKRLDSNTWELKTVNKYTPTLFVKVIQEIEENDSLITQSEFRVLRIPNPKPYISSKTDYFAAKKALLLSTSGISLKYEQLPFDLKSIVKSFKAQIAGNNNQVIEIEGNRFNDEIKELIKSTKKGDQLIFKDINCELPDSTIRKLSPIIVEIK